MRHITTKITLILTFLFLASCTDVRKAEYVQSQDHPQDAYPAPIKFSHLKVQLPVGAKIGDKRLGCLFSIQEVGRDYFREGINQPEIDDVFVSTLEAQGFDVIGRENTVFDEEYEDDFLRSEYKIGAKIIDAQVDLCEKAEPSASVFSSFIDPWHHARGGVGGKLYLKIEWAVYDALRRKVAYKTATEGYVNRKVLNKEGLPLMINEAFAMAAYNLGSDKSFHDLIFYNEKPTQNWQNKKYIESRPRIFNPNEELVISNLPLSAVPLINHAEKSGKVSVLVQAGSGYGSGFFVSDQGHIITNAHVVGDALRVRIVTSGGKEKLIAEVLRKNTKRDVALLKLEEKPEGLGIVTLPIRLKYPKVSEDIYALGAPEHKLMQDTLSKGIISSIRNNFRVHGSEMNFIQGDIAISKGNSGGALLDAEGNIIGISIVGIYQDIGAGDSRLNLFIPISDALSYLNISINP